MFRWFACVLLLSGTVLSGCAGDKTASAANKEDKGGREARSGNVGNARNAGDTGGPGGPESLPPREVRVTRAETGQLARTVVVSGTLAADEEAELGPKVAGRLSSLSVDLGSRVRRGQTLARLSPTDSELRVRQAQNALEQARAQLGLAQRKLGRLDAAEESYRTALGLLPEHRAALGGLGAVAAARRDLAGARAVLQRLEAACSFGCAEKVELERWIDVYASPSP